MKIMILLIMWMLISLLVGVFVGKFIQVGKEDEKE